MDCKRFRKYIGAFADGELDVEHNLDALEHLNMCPICTARVTEVATLRESLQRVYGNIAAPSHLKEKIVAMVRDDRITQTQGSARARRVIRLFVPLAAVASLLLVVAVWRPWTGARAPVLSAANLPAQLVANVRSQHRTCVWQRGPNHHDAARPRDPKLITTMLARDLGMVVAVPELGVRGYELVTVDRCRVGRRKASHAIYRSGVPNGELSFFTVERTASLASDRVATTPDRELVAADHAPLSVVGWHDGPQTYLACAEVPEHVLFDIVNSIRVQLSQAKRTSQIALAMIK